MPATQEDSIWPLLQRALRQMGWVDTELDSAPASPAELLEPCLFRHWLRLRTNNAPYLNQFGTRRVSQLVADGFSLRCSWPRTWAQSAAQWLGRRIFFSHARNFSESARLTSIVSSQIGRHGRKLPGWPRLIDGALRNSYRRGEKLLISPGTTIAGIVEQFGRAAGVPLLRATWTKHAELSDWLRDILSISIGSCASPAASSLSRNELLISPAIEEPSAELWKGSPLQDRVAVALADSIYALSIRPHGKIDSLLTERLQDANFPSASVYVAIDRQLDGTSGDTVSRWLACGAVGWLVTGGDSWSNPWLARCNRGNLAVARCQQLSGPLPAAWRQLCAAEDWSYLTHCTRASPGPMPEESLEQYRDRVWLDEARVAMHPLETLAKICAEGQLRGASTMTRASQRCVSLSAVPLAALLQRRTFRSHLSRWDWEPYGLIIRRSVLRELGARPVIYGSEDVYANLTAQERPFFQPLGRQRGDSKNDWSLEREWRVLGDLNLKRLPVDSVIAFVRNRLEALQMSRWSDWAVLWVDDGSADVRRSE